MEAKKRTIIISGLGPTYPLYAELSEHYEVAVYDPQMATRISVERGNIPTVCPLAGAQAPLYERARNDAALAVAQIVAHLHHDAFALDGARPTPARLANAQEWLPGMAAVYLTDVLTNLRALDAFADSGAYDVAGVVTHEDVTPRFRALALWGKARGLPTLHLPHNNCYLQVRPDVHDQSVCDWIVAASPYMRDWYAARGFPKERIKVAGFPGWDHWLGKSLNAETQGRKARSSAALRLCVPSLIPRGRARAVLQLAQDAPAVLFCTGWAQRTNFVDDHGLMEAAAHLTLQAAKREGWQVIWKLHPGDASNREADYAKLAAAYRVPAAVTRDHLSYCLRAADVVLSTGPSNVMVEAGICDTPMATFPLRGYGFDMEPPWTVEPTVEGVVECVGRLLERKEWERGRARFLRRYAFKVDGRAGERCVRWIRKIINAETQRRKELAADECDG